MNIFWDGFRTVFRTVFLWWMAVFHAVICWDKFTLTSVSQSCPSSPPPLQGVMWLRMVHLVSLYISRYFYEFLLFLGKKKTWQCFFVFGEKNQRYSTDQRWPTAQNQRLGFTNNQLSMRLSWRRENLVETTASYFDSGKFLISSSYSTSTYAHDINFWYAHQHIIWYNYHNYHVRENWHIIVVSDAEQITSEIPWAKLKAAAKAASFRRRMIWGELFRWKKTWAETSVKHPKVVVQWFLTFGAQLNRNELDWTRKSLKTGSFQTIVQYSTVRSLGCLLRLIC